MQVYSCALFRRYYLRHTLLDADHIKMLNSCFIMALKIADFGMNDKVYCEFFEALKLDKGGRQT